MALVYLARNTINGDEYVGATEKELNDRKYRHIWHSRNVPLGKFHRALRKYGVENFEWSVVEHCADFFHALEVERRVIRERSPAYNLTDGGGGIKGYKHTENSRRKMSEAKKGKPGIWARNPMPDYIRERLANARRAERGCRILPESAKIELRKNAKKANEARRKKVLNTETGEIYDSLVQAAKMLNASRSATSRACAGKTNSKLKIRYLEEK